MKSKSQASFKSIILQSIFPIKGLFPEGEGNEGVISLLHFLDKKVEMEGHFHHGVPHPSINIKCFLPEQWSSDERDQIINKIKETRDLLASLDGWAFDTGPAFPPKSMKTKQIRFEIRFEKPMPGWAPRKWGKDYQDFMLNIYPKVVKKHGLGRAEDMREIMASETGMDTYMKNRKNQQLVDSIDFADKLDEINLIFAFGTLVSKGNPTPGAVSNLKAAARRQGCSEAMIVRALAIHNSVTGSTLKDLDDFKSKSAQRKKQAKKVGDKTKKAGLDRET